MCFPLFSYSCWLDQTTTNLHVLRSRSRHLVFPTQDDSYTFIYQSVVRSRHVSPAFPTPHERWHGRIAQSTTFPTHNAERSRRLKPTFPLAIAAFPTLHLAFANGNKKKNAVLPLLLCLLANTLSFPLVLHSCCPGD